MQHDINQIKKLNDTHRTAPKLLIIPSAAIRTQMLKTLGDYGVYPLNMSVKTVRELSYDLAEHYIRTSDLTVLDGKGVTDAMTDVLKSLRDKGALTFLHEIEITSGICKALSKTVMELLGWGYLSGNVGLDKIDNDNKRKDIKTIVEAYAQWKKTHGYVDYSDVIEHALIALENRKSGFAGSYALEACEFNYLESLLLHKLGMQIGHESMGTTTLTDKEAHDLRHENIDFFDAYGEYNEVKEVMRRIIQEKIPFDNVLIVSTTNEPYTQLFYQLMQQYTYKNEALDGNRELPITFGTGLPLLMSSPARLLMLLLDWIDSSYGCHALVNIFSSGVFDVGVDQRDSDGVMPKDENRFRRLSVVNVIKNSGITWQKRSYLPALNNHLARLKSKKTDNIKAVKATEWLIKFISESFDLIPEEDKTGTVDVESLLAALKTIVEKYKRIFTAFDSQGLKVAIYELSTTIKGRRVRLTEAIEIIKEHMRDIRIKCESPAPGKIHFTTYRQAAWIERENVFLVGLGADKFPGMALEDSLILDHERMPPMITSTQRTKKSIDIMDSFIAGIKGNLTCSYSSFDTVENRECYPATLFHRLRKDSNDAKVYHAGFVVSNSEHFIDENDFWLSKGVRYGAILNGIEQVDPEEETEKELLEFAAHIAEQTLSASSLTTFLSCKHKFFLQNVLRLQEIKRQEIDSLGWLSSLEKGSAFHTIFENFLNRVIENPGILDNEEKAIKCIREIAEMEIARCEEELPTASNYHTELQKAEVIEDVVKFAANEVDRASERSVVYAELKFGMDEPMSIELGDGKKLMVSGKIDRVDITKDGNVEITDFKSGSKWGFYNLQSPEDAGITESNAQLAFYYLAIRELARTSNDPKLARLKNIIGMSYQFITAKGDYDVVSLQVTDDSEQCYKTAFIELLEEIEKGYFPAEKGTVRLSGKDKNPSCTYCGYNTVCTYVLGLEED